MLRAALLLFPLAAIWLLAGCNPASLAMILMPFMDDKEPAKYKISAPGKDVNLAIVTWFGNPALQTWPDLMPTDHELSDKLAVYLRDRYALNREKVKIVPGAQVRACLNKPISESYSPADIGKKLKAD